MRTIALVAAAALLACGRDPATSGEPEVTESYRLDRDPVDCWDTAAEYDLSMFSPREYACVWACATYEGERYVRVGLRWAREGEAWVEAYRNLYAGDWDADCR